MEGNSKKEGEVAVLSFSLKILPYNISLLHVLCMTLNDRQGWRTSYGKGSSVKTEQTSPKGNLRTRTERAAKGNSDVQKYIYFQQFQNHCLFYSRNIQMEQ